MHEERRHACKKLKEREHLGSTGTDGRIILNSTGNKL
jgi:hypothetical protein